MKEISGVDNKLNTDKVGSETSSGFSIIVCSVHPEKLDALRENIRHTIGDIEFEFIAFDNREEKLPIAVVYNRSAACARFDNLFFVHEDVEMLTPDWGAEIAAKLAEKDCGVIGFAGTIALVDAPGGWNSKRGWIACNYLGAKGNHERSELNPGERFEPAVAVDGFGMYVRKDVWQEFPFDEDLLRGFHCYDVDFSLAVGAKYRNYVVMDILAHHYSDGNFGREWIEATWHCYSNKWRHGMLPRVVAEAEISPKELDYNAERVTFRVLKLALDLGVENKGIERIFWSYPLTFRHFEHVLKISWRKFKKLYR